MTSPVAGEGRRPRGVHEKTGHGVGVPYACEPRRCAVRAAQVFWPSEGDGPDVALTTTMPDGTSSTVTYDTAADPIKVTRNDLTGAVLASTGASYDADGNQLTAVDARGITSTFAYDATGALTQEVQPTSPTDSITTSFGYDADGNRTRMTDGRGNAGPTRTTRGACPNRPSSLRRRRTRRWPTVRSPRATTLTASRWRRPSPAGSA
ncbi:MAG TPA: RHS repeat domain-containing protein [Pseudonocardiaceae bacterium]|nr:RHS repeat domain-containing protein [Pseudonocardiaceae bacterium]